MATESVSYKTCNFSQKDSRMLTCVIQDIKHYCITPFQLLYQTHTGVTCLLSFSLGYLWNKFYFLSVTFLLSPAQTVILSLIKLEVHNGHHYFPPGIYCLMTRTVFSKLQNFLNLSSFLFSIYLLFEREREQKKETSVLSRFSHV